MLGVAPLMRLGFPEMHAHLLTREQQPRPPPVRVRPGRTLPGHGDQGQASPSLPVCDLWLVLSATSGPWCPGRERAWGYSAPFW